MPTTTPVSGRLRAEVAEITATWERAIQQRIPALGRLDRAALLDHMPELLFGLASWVDSDGDDAAHRACFTTLVQGHAIQRLGHGIALDTLTTEYQVLRSVVLTHVLARESAEDVAAELVRLNEGIDFAVSQAVQQYTGQRELIRQRFVTILGHDLRNPLNAIALAAEQIATIPCAEQRHLKAAGVIRRSAERMSRMVDDVIDITHARIGQGIPSVPVKCVMGEIVEEAVAELRLAHPDRDLRVELTGDSSGTWDRARVLQVVSNLLSNALEHGRDPVIVRVTEAPERRAVILAVENRGAPIPPATLARLFEPFRQGPPPIGPLGQLGAIEGASTAAGREPAGLGLYIVQQVAASHGAQLEVTSTEDGTTFEITWPRIPRELVPDRP
jgi:signal transduction histidine kinase